MGTRPGGIGNGVIRIFMHSPIMAAVPRGLIAFEIVEAKGAEVTKLPPVTRDRRRRDVAGTGDYGPTETDTALVLDIERQLQAVKTEYNSVM